MLEFDFNNKCYGCGACSSVCPVTAISMLQNEEGFLMPSVNNEKCIHCGKCKKVCPYINHNNNTKKLEDVNAYTFYIKSKSTLKKSASGGAFFAYAKFFIDNGNYVCGCILDENLVARHVVTNNVNVLEKMRGSKYIQSNISTCYSEIASIINQGIEVLFCGTPCQVSAIQQYFKNNKNNNLIFTISLICHGVPSPLVWRKYKEYLEKKYKQKMVSATHRYKGNSYNIPLCKYEFSNGKKITYATYLEDIYCYGFGESLYLRNTCYECQYKGAQNCADLIIGDYFSYNDPKFDGIMGVSALIANSQKGEELVNKLGSDYYINSISVEQIMLNNPYLIKSVSYNPKRKVFFNMLDEINIKKVVLKCVNPYKYLAKLILYKIGLFEKFKRKL